MSVADTLVDSPPGTQEWDKTPCPSCGQLVLWKEDRARGCKLTAYEHEQMEPMVLGRGQYHRCGQRVLSDREIVSAREYPPEVPIDVIDSAVTATFSEFPQDSWRQASLREVAGVVTVAVLSHRHVTLASLSQRLAGGRSNLTPEPQPLCDATPATGFGRPVVVCNRDRGHLARQHRGTLPNGQVYLWSS